MASSVFDVICPICGADMELSAPGEGRCRACGRSYLVRSGHVIPIAPGTASLSGTRLTRGSTP